MKSVFFVPVYNEIMRFPEVLGALRAQPPACDEILLVNNGSSDGSERLVREAGYPFLDLPQNRGVGYSYMKGLEWALDRDFDVFGTMASNGKMLPGEMGRLLDPLRAGEVDYVTGSRFLPGGDSPNLPSFRRQAIPWVSTFASWLARVALTDATCGYRAFRLDLIRRADFDWRAPWLHTYGLEYYFYAKVLLDGHIGWREVPITMGYPERGRPYSKIPPITGWWQMLRPWWVARLDGRGFADIA